MPLSPDDAMRRLVDGSAHAERTTGEKLGMALNELAQLAGQQIRREQAEHIEIRNEQRQREREQARGDYTGILAESHRLKEAMRQIVTLADEVNWIGEELTSTNRMRGMQLANLGTRISKLAEMGKP